MSVDWKRSLLEGRTGDLPDGYRREEGLIGREELLGEVDHRFWSESEFVARARQPHTTSAAEATIRGRQLKRMVESFPIDTESPALELGCADGLVTRYLLDLGFQKLVSTDMVHSTISGLAGSLTDEERERVVLVVDDMMRLPLTMASFDTVIAWGILSVTPDFEHSLQLAWSWVKPGGYLLVAEPLLESVLAYTLVRGDLEEFRRTLAERTRAAMWDKREDRYRVNTWRYYETRLARMEGASIEDRGGVSMLPSLILGGIVQDSPMAQEELDELTALITDQSIDELTLWRQAHWLVRKG